MSQLWMAGCSYFLGFTLILLMTLSVSAGTEFYYASDLDPILNILGGTFVNENQGTPPNPTGPAGRAFFSVWAPVDDATSKVISGWNLGDFTGAPVPLPLARYQLGYNPASYGGTAVEIHQQTSSSGLTYPVFGAMLNTWNFPVHKMPPEIAAAQVKYRWDPAQNKRPWSHGPSSVFRFSFMLQVPTAYATAQARAYIGPVFTLEDTTHPGHYFWFELNVFDTGGGVTTDSIGWDPGTSAVMVGSYFGTGARYVSKETSSYSSTTSPWSGWRWYGFSVSRSQLITAIHDVNRTYPDAKFSTRPEDYRLGMIMIDAEIDWPSGNANIAYSTHGINVYSDY